ncbi:claudin-4-like isoform X2 [Poeciliopsis prolifica]|uniref:claudin-4-like isoform X2 n=1 Tax=Poeciliopsis prolifica TaxID=188132 RepID=UPI0024139C6E|nr:claudin-4-like isoform X2 [Poeciliopsis prolifica]
MVSQGIQITGIVIATIGWLLDIAVCGLPMWRVSAFVGANIITAQTIWEGLWMSCVVQSTGQMQCKVYDSMLALEQDLQAARAMIIVSILLGIAGVFLAIAGGKCTNCIEDERSKSKVLQPDVDGNASIRVGSVAVHRLGSFHLVSDWRGATVLELPQQ